VERSIRWPRCAALSLGDVARAGEGRAPGVPGTGDCAHPAPMAHEINPPAPGSLTVPPLFGWEGIATVVVLVVAVAVVFLVVAVTRAGADQRSEWQAWLDARSSARRDPGPGPDDRLLGDGEGRGAGSATDARRAGHGPG
jgi:hypothetical protein